MKPRITASYIFKMVQGPMSLKPRKVADYVCDEVGGDTCVRKEGSRRKKNLTIIFKLLPIAILNKKITSCNKIKN